MIKKSAPTWRTSRSLFGSACLAWRRIRSLPAHRPIFRRARSRRRPRNTTAAVIARVVAATDDHRATTTLPRAATAGTHRAVRRRDTRRNRLAPGTDVPKDKHRRAKIVGETAAPARPRRSNAARRRHRFKRRPARPIAVPRPAPPTAAGTEPTADRVARRNHPAEETVSVASTPAMSPAPGRATDVFRAGQVVADKTGRLRAEASRATIKRSRCRCFPPGARGFPAGSWCFVYRLGSVSCLTTSPSRIRWGRPPTPLFRSTRRT